ncbi:hypothetical protein DFJ63DRAFT_311387 [Scheffersomyces coipomensis]|uniref:uncharacterized protein n=1 Tax=Scheffersomyces coipomensis TaxID=1788519 RepID=UPI00315CDB66
MIEDTYISVKPYRMYYISETNITSPPPFKSSSSSFSRKHSQTHPFYWFHLSIIESLVLLGSVYLTNQFPIINFTINRFINELLIYPNIILLVLLIINTIFDNIPFFNKCMDIFKLMLFQFYVILMFNGPLKNFNHGIIITSLINFVYFYHDLILYLHQQQSNPKPFTYVVMVCLGLISFYECWELLLHFSNLIHFNVGEHVISYVFPLSIVIIIVISVYFSDDDEEDDDYDHNDLERKPLLQV